MALALTKTQVELARHALGLPNNRKKSFRNRFVAGANSTNYPEWMAMVAMGAAKRVDASRLPFGGDDMFYLTMSGARAALVRGECLCPEDFPKDAPLQHESACQSGRMIERAAGAE